MEIDAEGVQGLTWTVQPMQGEREGRKKGRERKEGHIVFTNINEITFTRASCNRVMLRK